MLNGNERQESVFELIKSMSKAEKRNFKLYATRLSGNQEAKFLRMFDYLDSAEQYDEVKLLDVCPIKKSQLPNMKAHLYKQILISIRLLRVQHSLLIELREQVDFARILYDKGLHKQSHKFLSKAYDQAISLNQHNVALNIIDFARQSEMMNFTPEGLGRIEQYNKQSEKIGKQILRLSRLSNISSQLYSLYQKLGYARTKKDIDLIRGYFQPKLDSLGVNHDDFLERFHYLQSLALFYYIQHDFVHSYRYARRWVGMMESNPQMKEVMYDSYLNGYAQILEGLFLMRKHKQFVENLEEFEKQSSKFAGNENAEFIARHIIITSKINLCFLEGSFDKGIAMVENIEDLMIQYARRISTHKKMLLNYKIACLYFGNDDFVECIRYLSPIINTKDPDLGRDLQCFARILNLIASYEAGIDHNLDYQIRSVYAFVVKMNDMQEVQKEMLTFLKRIESLYENEFKDEFKILYKRMKPLEESIYTRRSFYYLDIISWLESKISGHSIAEIIQRRFREESSSRKKTNLK